MKKVVKKIANWSSPIEAYEELVEQLNGNEIKITAYIESQLKRKLSNGEAMSGWIDYMHTCYWNHQNNLHQQHIKNQQ
jgi:hypothetical protein